MLSSSFLRLCCVFLLLPLQVSYGQGDDRDMMIPTSWEEIPEYQRENLVEEKFKERYVVYNMSINSTSKQSNGTLALNATAESLSFTLKINSLPQTSPGFNMVIGNSVAVVEYMMSSSQVLYVIVNDEQIGRVNKTEPLSFPIEILRENGSLRVDAKNTDALVKLDCNEKEQCKLNYTLNWENSMLNTELWIPVDEFLVEVPPPTTTTTEVANTTLQSNISTTQAPQSSSTTTTQEPKVSQAGNKAEGEGLKWGIGLTLFVILYAAVAAVAVFYYRHQKKELEKDTPQSLQTPSTVTQSSIVKSDATTQQQQPSSSAATGAQTIKSKKTQKSSQQTTKKVLHFTPSEANKVNLPPPSSSKS